MATELISKFPEQIGEIDLHGGVGGAFEVSINGEPVFSKLESKRYPELAEIVEPVRARLPGGVPA
jgi:selenoprotein W-related protein